MYVCYVSANLIIQWKPVNMTTVGPWNTGHIRTLFSEKKTTECFYVCSQIIETLKSRFLGKSCDQGLAVRFAV